MQAVLLWKDMAQVADKMDPAVFQYVGERQTESFEALEHFDLLAFDWYDVRKGGKSEKVLVYLDQEDLFFFCRDEAAAQYVRGAVQGAEQQSGVTDNQQLLYRFFAGLFKGTWHIWRSWRPRSTRARASYWRDAPRTTHPAHCRVAAGAAAAEAVLRAAGRHLRRDGRQRQRPAAGGYIGTDDRAGTPDGSLSAKVCSCRSWWRSCGRPIRASWPSSRTT